MPSRTLICETKHYAPSEYSGFSVRPSSMMDMDSLRLIKGHPGVGVEERLMRRFPRLAARLYDILARLTLDSMYLRVAQEIASSIDSGTVLDVGTGPGRLPLELARLAPALAITGVDLSPAMIDLARRKIYKWGMESRVAFLPGDAAALPVPDASFDMVVTTLSVHHWHDQRKGIAELHRAMKPGGATWVYDMYSEGIQQAFEELIGSSPFREYEMSRVNYSRWLPGHGLLKIELR